MTFTVHVDQTFIRDEIEFSVVRVGGVEKRGGDEPLAERKPQRWTALVASLERTRRPTIIYTMSQREAERIAVELTPLIGACLAYHAGLAPGRRRVVESEFLEGRCDVIVATNAFGMGIDKADIRSVIHWSLPATPEALYQEAGRAARGLHGERAHAVLIFHEADLDDAYRTVRSEVPHRREIERVDRVLRETADLQQRSIVTIADNDLALLAGLRPSLSVRVVLAHLERAGLVDEVDRHYATMAVRRRAGPATDLTPLEEGILCLVGDGRDHQLVSMAAMVGIAESTGIGQVSSALMMLVRRGLLEQRRFVAARLLVAEPETAVQETRSQALAVWNHLNGPSDGPRRFHRSLARVGGNAQLTVAAVEVMAFFGLIDVRYDPADGTVPRARVARTADLSRLKEAFAAARKLPLVLKTADLSRTLPVDEIGANAGLEVADVLSGLSLLHVIGAASVDLRSWEAMPPQGVAREIAIVDVPDRDEWLARAVRANVDRARLARLRLETLRRYAQIEPDGDAAGGGGRDAYQAYLEQYLTEPDFLDRIADDTTASLVAPLTQRQREIVEESATDQIVILAGPGTGKTRTLVTRIAYRVRVGYVLPERTLAVTFTRAATSEMRARLASFGVRGVDVRTLDSLAIRIVSENWSAMGFPALPSVIEPKEQRRLLMSLDPQANVQKELQEIGKRKARRQELISSLHVDYQEALRAKNLIDFQDAKGAAAVLLGRDNDSARLYLDQFDEVYVDEFQDLSPLQIDLVDAIARDAQLTIVGDPRQAIYEWNGATPEELLARFDRTPKKYELVENFRSSRPILSLANEVIAKVLPDVGPVVAVREGDEPDVEGAAVANEAAMIGRLVSTVHGWLAQGVPDSEIAVLARTNTMVATVASGLNAAGIRSHAAGLPRVASTHAFVIAVRYAGSAPPAEPDDGDSLVDTLDCVRALDDVVDALGGGDDEEAAQNEADWGRLRQAINDLDLAGSPDLASALAQIGRDDDGPAERTGVTVTTMSSSKGLEWDAVAVTDLGETQMLDSLGDEETGRILFVALTRARRHLHVSWHGLPTKWLP